MGIERYDIAPVVTKEERAARAISAELWAEARKEGMGTRFLVEMVAAFQELLLGERRRWRKRRE